MRWLRRRFFGLAWILACLLTLVAGGARAALAPPPPEQRTYVELVFDSSSSMNQRVEGQRTTRMEVAKDVLSEVIQSLPDRPDLEVALRVYGAQLKGSGCTDSALAHKFAPITGVRRQIIETVRSLTPRGLTPIAYSLEQAAKDFPVRKGPRNVIILITDGEESCGGNPCKVSKRLQSEGLIVEPYVVGFAVSEAEAASLRCIGQYYPARDADSLRLALTSIVAKAIQPATVLVEAWGGGRSVLPQTEVELRGADGKVVPVARAAAGATVVPVSVEPGLYTVRGRLSLGGQDLFAEAPGLRVEEAQQAVARLDFGDLTGKVALSVQGGGRDLSDQVEIRVSQGGAPVATEWQGLPLTATLPAGAYEASVSLRARPTIMRPVQFNVAPGKVTPLAVDLGDLPGTLVVTVSRGGEDVTRHCQLALYRDTLLEVSWPTGFDVFRYDTAAATYRLVLRYNGELPAEKQVTGVVVQPLEETRVTVNLDDNLGAIEVKVLGNGRDITSSASVRAEGAGRAYEFGLTAEGVRRVVVPPGVYPLRASYKGGLAEGGPLEVTAGKVARATLELVIPGRLSLRSLLDGRPLTPSEVEGKVYLGDDFVGSFSPEGDLSTITVPPGTYRVLGICAPAGGQVQEAEATVEEDRITEVTLSFAADGRVRFTATQNGRPLRGASVALHHEGGEFATYLEEVEPGLWQAAVEEGTYELRIDPKVAGFEERTFPGLFVATGEVVERSLDLSQGKVRFIGTLSGKPLKGANVTLYREDGAFVSYLKEIEPGLWELAPAEGTYELRVNPDIPGYEERRFPGLVVKNGETIERNLVLGDGKLRFTGTLNGKPLKGAGVDLYREDGPFVAHLRETGPGTWELGAAEGTYELRVNPNVPGIEERRLPGIVLKADAPVEKSLAFGQGKVRFTATMNGQPLKSAGVDLYNPEGAFITHLQQTGPGTWEAAAAEGEYELRVDPNIPGYEWRRVPGIVLKADAPVEKSLAFGQGRVRFTATMNGQPLKSAGVDLYSLEGQYVSHLQQTGPGTWEVSAAEGEYELRVNPNIPGYEWRRVTGIVLKAGAPVVEKSLAFGQGKVRFTATMNGQPLKSAGVDLYSLEGQYVSHLQQTGPGTWEVAAAEGEYELRVNPNIPGYEWRRVTGIVLKAGAPVVEKSLAFGQGKVRFTATMNGQPLKEKGVQVSLLDEEGRFVTYLRATEPGRWEVAVAEGTYTLRFNVDLAGFRERQFRELDLKTGETIERALAVGQGKVSMKVTAAGKPVEKATLSLQQDGRFLAYLKAAGPGLWTLEVAEGTYDVSIRPAAKELGERWLRDQEVTAGQALQLELTYQ